MQINRRAVVKHVLYINTLTLLGSYLSFVPVSTFLSKNFGFGTGFAIVLVLARLPAFLFPRVYSFLANKYGSAKVITWSQFFSGLIALLVIGLISMDSLPLILIGLFLLYCLSSSLSVLFPAILKKVSESDPIATRPFAHWQISKHIAVLLAMSAGGYCANIFDVRLFIFIDALTFFATFLIWRHNANVLMQFNESNHSSDKLSLIQYLSPLNVSNILKKLIYGVFNPIIPVILLDKFGLSSAALGNLYFLLGLCVLIGATLISRVSPSFLMIISGCFLEITLIAVSLLVKVPWCFFLCVCLAAFIMGGIDVLLQTSFVRKAKEGFAAANSAIFESSINGALLIGYGIFGILGKYVHLVIWVYAFLGISLLMLLALTAARGRHEI